MGAKYRKVDPRIWNDEKFCRLTDDGQLAFLFILTHPSMTCLGAMRGTIEGLAAEKHWPYKRFRDAIKYAMPDAIPDASLFPMLDDNSYAYGMLEIDPENCFIAAPNFLRYNPPEGPNSIIKAWPAALDLIPECAGRKRLIYRCRQYLDSMSDKMKDAMVDAIWHAFPDAIPDAMSDAHARARLKGAGAGTGVITPPNPPGNSGGGREVRTPRFRRPTPEEVEEYAGSIDFELSGQAFIDHYESKGWKIGKSPMKDWRAAVRTWKHKRETEAAPKLTTKPVCTPEGFKILDDVYGRRQTGEVSHAGS